MLVPLREVFERLEYAVHWNQDTNTAVLTNDQYKVEITVGSTLFTTNQKEYSLDVSAQIIDGRIMVPFRAVLESIGCQVNWESHQIKFDFRQNRIIITTPHTMFQEEKLLQKVNPSETFELVDFSIGLVMHSSGALSGVSLVERDPYVN